MNIHQGWLDVIFLTSSFPAWNMTSGSRRSFSWKSSIGRLTWTTLIILTSPCLGVQFSRKFQSQRWRAKSCARPFSSGSPGRPSMHMMFNSHSPVWVTSRLSFDAQDYSKFVLKLHPLYWKTIYFVPIPFLLKVISVKSQIVRLWGHKEANSCWLA